MAAPHGVLAEERARVPALPESLQEVYASMERFWNALDQALPARCGSARRLAFDSGVAEIATNIMRHAYPPGDAGWLEVSFRAYANRVEAHLTDQGLLFTSPMPRNQSPGDADDLMALAEGGYGLALARAAVDDLEYDRTPDGVNHWRLVQWLEPPPATDVAAP